MAVWRATGATPSRTGGVEVVIEPFVKAPAWACRAAGQEAERLAAFLGCTLKLDWKG